MNWCFLALIAAMLATYSVALIWGFRSSPDRIGSDFRWHIRWRDLHRN
jgi:transposase